MNVLKKLQIYKNSYLHKSVYIWVKHSQLELQTKLCDLLKPRANFKVYVKL